MWFKCMGALYRSTQCAGILYGCVQHVGIIMWVCTVYVNIMWVCTVCGYIMLVCTVCVYCDNRPPKCMLRGAKPLGPCGTSNFVPYACNRVVTEGECEGPVVPHRRPLFPVVAWQRKGRTVLRGLSHLYFPSLG